jgi:hypothetical protein
MPPRLGRVRGREPKEGFTVQEKPLVTPIVTMPAAITADRFQPGLKFQGSSNGRHKLTEAQVLDIYTSSDIQAAAARRHGITRHTVRLIRAGKRWAWLTQQLQQAEQRQNGAA